MQSWIFHLEPLKRELETKIPSWSTSRCSSHKIKKKKGGETIIDILGRGTLGRPGGVFRPDPRRGGGRKAAAFSFCVVYDPCCWLTASPNWLAAVMYFNNVRMLDGYSVTSKRCWIELPTPLLALFFFFFLSPWSWIFNKKWFLMKLIILI